LLQNVGQLNAVFGPSPQKMPELFANSDLVTIPFTIKIGDHDIVVIDSVDVLGFITAAVLVLLLEYLVFRTKRGMAMRAVSAFVLGTALFVAADFLYRTFAGKNDGHDIVIDSVDVLIFITAAVLMLLLEYLVFRTKLGTAMRAVSFNTDTASLMGIPVDRVISFTFVLGSALAAAAGFLYALKYPSLNQPAHTVWVLLGLKAFVAAVIGGIGHVRGALLGGFVIAGVEQFGAFYISTNYRDVYVFALLILILLVLPTGLLGSPIREKV
jgi:branched-chain amino acid transport system permease protein